VLFRVLDRADDLEIGLLVVAVTGYVNTIPAANEPPIPGDEEMEHRIRRLIRWNAAVMVSRANKRAKGIGGHLATYASSAALYEVGFNHFFRGKDDGQAGDQVYFAVAAGSPATPPGAATSGTTRPSSMGLGTLTAAYQVRFNRSSAIAASSTPARRGLVLHRRQ